MKTVRERPIFQNFVCYQLSVSHLVSLFGRTICNVAFSVFSIVISCNARYTHAIKWRHYMVPYYGAIKLLHFFAVPLKV